MGIEKYRTSQGTFWKVDLEVTAADGRFVRFRKRKVPTREMAEELASKMRIEAFEGRFFDRPKTATLTVAEVWQAYEPICRRTTRHVRRRLDDRATFFATSVGGRR